VTTDEFDWAKLLQHSRASALHAYSPYSKFRVGAAVIDDAGNLFGGCNIESASFGLTVCAERVAMFVARASGSVVLKRLAVTCLDAPAGPLALRMPCGACRQVMAELLEPDAEIFVDGVGAMKLEELLPNAFRLTETRPAVR
jgi:cytidine deaminase